MFLHDHRDIMKGQEGGKATWRKEEGGFECLGGRNGEEDACYFGPPVFCIRVFLLLALVLYFNVALNVFLSSSSL